MSFLHSTIIFYFINLISLSIGSASVAFTKGFIEELQTNNKPSIILVLLQPVHSVVSNNDGGTPGARVKRQGASKFAESASMSQTKSLQLYLQMYKNLLASSHIGGSHPFHPQAVKPVIALFKLKIIEFFFPDVGEGKE